MSVWIRDCALTCEKFAEYVSVESHPAKYMQDVIGVLWQHLLTHQPYLPKMSSATKTTHRGLPCGWDNSWLVIHRKKKKCASQIAFCHQPQKPFWFTESSLHEIFCSYQTQALILTFVKEYFKDGWMVWVILLLNPTELAGEMGKAFWLVTLAEMQMHQINQKLSSHP